MIINKKQVSLLSTIANVLLAGMKLLIGFMASSAAIIASGIDSLSDILSSFLVYIGIKFSEKEVSAKYPYGLYRAESISSFIVFLFVLLASLGIIYDGVIKLVNQSFDVEVSMLALGVMLFSAIVSGILSFLKLKIGKIQNSVSLVLDGKHSLIDVLTSIGVLVGLLLSNINPIFDCVIGILIGIYILFETLKMGKDVIDGLLDTADEESEKKIRQICSSEEVTVSNIKSRRVAGKTFIELEIILPADVKVRKADEMILNLQKLILDRIEHIEHIVIQIKGGEKRHPISRSDNGGKKKVESSFVDIKSVPQKKGFRTIYPYKKGEISKDFGSDSYLIVDTDGSKIIQKKVVKNPFYHIGRSYGVKFVRLMKADKLVASNIGENAKKKLKQSNIEVSEK
jgi:cation diffusion facilitator family transporter